MNEQEIEEWKIKIAGMDQVEMARLWRFAPSGHPCFNAAFPLFKIFKTRFEELGGFIPSVSKLIDGGK